MAGRKVVVIVGSERMRAVGGVCLLVHRAGAGTRRGVEKEDGKAEARGKVVTQLLE